jgi:hypothetical protein
MMRTMTNTRGAMCMRPTDTATPAQPYPTDAERGYMDFRGCRPIGSNRLRFARSGPWAGGHGQQADRVGRPELCPCSPSEPTVAGDPLRTPAANGVKPVHISASSLLP